MKSHSVSISEIIQINGENCLRIEHAIFQQARAGQYLQAFGTGENELLPILLFPCQSPGQGWIFCGNFPRSWQPGMQLHLRGPRGNGFHLPPLAKKVALTSLDQVHLNRLLPLAFEALENGAEVCILTGTHPSDLPPEIELLPLDELHQIKNWADYLAACLPPAGVAVFQQELEINLGRNDKLQVEVMLDVPVICDEVSACGICAVNTGKGWKLACKDGPVFPLAELMIEDSANG
jgi:NAD(P)H-flavin reductase